MEIPLLTGKSPVELVINDHSIRYIEMKQQNPPVPLKWGERFLPPGIIQEGKIIDRDSLAMILEECIDVWKIRRRRVRFLVPDPYVTIRKVPIPADIHIDEITGYLYLEVGETIHLPFEDPVFDFIVLPSQDNKREILLFAANRQHVMEYSSLLTEVKLKPDAADLSALALYRFYYHFANREEDERLLLVQFDLDVVNMSIFENQTPFFMRHHHLPVDGNDWDIKVGRSGFQQLSFIGNEEELSQQFNEVYKEINKLIDFYQFSFHQGKNEMSKLILSGDHPLLYRIKEELQERFELEVKLLDAAHLHTEKQRPLPRSHYLALGLGLKEV